MTPTRWTIKVAPAIDGAGRPVIYYHARTVDDLDRLTREAHRAATHLNHDYPGAGYTPSVYESPSHDPMYI